LALYKSFIYYSYTYPLRSLERQLNSSRPVIKEDKYGTLRDHYV